MKLLYAAQGTGNGHISRARTIIPYLKKFAEVDVLVSGTQVDVPLEHTLNYKLHGFSFIFGQNGGVNLFKTVLGMKSRQLLSDVRSLPVHQYDLVVNDFEPVTALACKLKSCPIVGFGHQASFLSLKVPRAKTSFWTWQELILKYYAPVSNAVGFHFKPYDSFIRTPIIRSEIRNAAISNLGHCTVYLPAFSDKVLIPYLSKVKDVNWEVFSKHSANAYQYENVSVYPITNEGYIKSLTSCEGLLTGAGFEGPAEALFLKKKLLVIPMNNQWEQLCNAAALRQMGVWTVDKLTHNFPAELKQWIENSQVIPANYPDETGLLVKQLLQPYI